MRRSILIAVLVGALVGLAVATGISVAGSGGDGSPSSGDRGAAAKANGSFKAGYAAKRGRHRGRGGHRHGHGRGMFAPLRLAFGGVADRLGVSKSDLRDAAKGVKKRALDRAVSDGTITAAERTALERCVKGHARKRKERRQGGRRRGACDHRKARAAHRKLHRAFKARARDDAAGLKTQLIDDLAAELGKQPGEVDQAIRAELSELLDKGVALGFVSERGRDLALGCWDRPNECDQAALRAEVKKRFRGRHGGPHRGGRRP